MKVKWKELAPLPECCTAHTAVFLHGSVYVGGGSAGKNEKVRDCYRLDIYNLITNRWDSTPITTPYCSFAMTVLDDKLIIVGGEKDNAPTNKVHVLDCGEWKCYSTMPTARTTLCAVGYQSRLIAVGGQIKVDSKWTRTATTEILDTSNGCWYTCDDLPIPHSQLKATVVNNTLYLLGGYTAGLKPSSQVITASLDNLSSHQLKWQSLPDTPWCVSAPVALYNKFILTVGGRRPHDLTSKTTEVCAFNPSTGVWEQIANIPSARTHSGIANVTNGMFIMMGGANIHGDFLCDTWIGHCI